MTPKAPRPQRIESTTLEVPCPCGRVYVHITFKPGTREPFEVFARLGKSGCCAAAVVSAMCSTASIALRSGTDPRDIFKGLVGISCHRSNAYDQDRLISSCADAIAHALSEFLPKED